MSMYLYISTQNKRPYDLAHATSIHIEWVETHCVVNMHVRSREKRDIGFVPRHARSARGWWHGACRNTLPVCGQNRRLFLPVNCKHTSVAEELRLTLARTLLICCKYLSVSNKGSTRVPTATYIVMLYPFSKWNPPGGVGATRMSVLFCFDENVFENRFLEQVWKRVFLEAPTLKN